MVNEVLQTVLDYIKLPNTDHAVLINGPWGCGKTYFWKYTVEPQLKSLLESKQIERIMYVSLYGTSNVKDIDRSIFAQSYPGINHKFVGRVSRFLGGAAEALGRVDLEKVDLRLLARVNGLVICFDDLERSNLPFKEVLGYINTFVEHEGAKVVILCNEKALDEEDVTLYRKMKEKVVGNSLDYKPDYKTVLSTLTDEYNNQKEFHEFLTKNTELILHLFKSSETGNLRSLRRAITTLNMVFKTIHEKGIDPNLLAERLVYAVAPTAFELYGRAADPEKLKLIHSKDYMYLAGISILSRKKEETTEKQYEEIFNERYFNMIGFLDMGRAVGCPPICDYMITGYLDKELLFEWATKLTKAPDEKEQCIKQLLSDPRGLEDHEFQSMALRVLGYVESGDIPEIKAYVSLYGHFEWYVNVGLIISNREQVLEKFKQGLQKAQKTGNLIPGSHLEFEIGHLLEKPRSKECQDFCDYILKTNEQMFETQRFDRIQKLLSQFQDDPMAFLNAFTDHGEGGLMLTPVFHRLDVNEIATKVLSMPNDLRWRFRSALNARYLKYQPQKEYIEELPGLIGIRDAIKSHCKEPAKGSAIPMSLFVTQNIVQTLDQAIERLQELNRKKEEPVVNGQPLQEEQPDQRLKRT